MKKLFCFSALLSVLSLGSYAQDPVSLTFNSSFLSHAVGAEYITITNITHGGDTTLIWPDNILTMIPVNSGNLPAIASGFKLFQNSPNPVIDGAGTTFKTLLPGNGSLQIRVADITGRIVTSMSLSPGKGISTFRFIPGKSRVYFISAIFEGQSQTIKVISATPESSNICSLQFVGTEQISQSLKSSQTRSNFVFYTGDSLVMTAKFQKFTITIIDTPVESEMYYFHFSEILSGENSKTWRLIRDVTTGRYPLQVGPADETTIWWALGLQQPLWERICMFNDEWTFTSGGEMLFHTLGDFWAENEIFHPDIANTCQPSSNMYGPFNEDFSAWDDGDHLYLVSEENVTVNGLGAYIAFVLTGTNMQVTEPQEEIIYTLEKMSDAATDTLILRCNYMAGDMPAYWRYVLVHYDNPEDEPPMPYENFPVADFDISQPEGMTVYLTNTSSNFDELTWDFGDGQTSTQFNPAHTYQTNGKYLITLTVSNGMGSDVKKRYVLVPVLTLTNELLTGDPWKVSTDEFTVFVGPELGSPEWWSVPLTEMLPGGSWSCLVNDEFIFNSNGSYEYKTNGDARNDGYMGFFSTGCITDAELLASGNGAAFQSAIHTYSFYPGNNPYIIFTNGSPSTAAFIGFYKGYYGGENGYYADPPNGGLLTNRYEILGYTNDGIKEYLFLSVDLNGAEPNGASWSYFLERDLVRE